MEALQRAVEDGTVSKLMRSMDNVTLNRVSADIHMLQQRRRQFGTCIPEPILPPSSSMPSLVPESPGPLISPVASMVVEAKAASIAIQAAPGETAAPATTKAADRPACPSVVRKAYPSERELEIAVEFGTVSKLMRGMDNVTFNKVSADVLILERRRRLIGTCISRQYLASSTTPSSDLAAPATPKEAGQVCRTGDLAAPATTKSRSTVDFAAPATANAADRFAFPPAAGKVGKVALAEVSTSDTMPDVANTMDSIPESDASLADKSEEE